MLKDDFAPPSGRYVGERAGPSTPLSGPPMCVCVGGGDCGHRVHSYFMYVLAAGLAKRSPSSMLSNTTSSLISSTEAGLGPKSAKF